ncbi:MAG: DUF2851 family protein, partial [Saprospiraceae bacterium]|nr:DUF2851 family protein [Saprospiraceae bacterium]
SLKGKIPKNIIQNYWKLYNNQYWIPCQEQILSENVTQFRFQAWLDRLVIERLERKTAPIHRLLDQNQNDWEQSFYEALVKSFGSKVNANAFEQLAKSLPFKILHKHRNNLQQLEALLLGQAGLLKDSFEETYPKKLKKEYEFLKKKYKLHTLVKTIWKFGKIRPAAYPTIRIAQLAQLIQQSPALFSKVLVCKTLKQFKDLFQIELSGYWHNHYHLGKISKKRSKSLGQSTVHSILINSIIPFLFTYGKRTDNFKFKDRALKLLESIKGESNSVLDRWEELGFPAPSAYCSQALLELKNNYCDQKKCTNCTIGHRLIQK